MSSKKSVEVIIDGKVYTLSGFEEEAYLQQIASYMNRKIGELRSLEDYSRLHSDMKSLLLQLNIADDYFKAKDMILNLEKELEQKEKEIYDLKHEIISKQIKIETAEKKLLQSEQENKDLLLRQARLEAVMENNHMEHNNYSNMDEDVKIADVKPYGIVHSQDIPIDYESHLNIQNTNAQNFNFKNTLEKKTEEKPHGKNGTEENKSRR